ncbi:hydrolytic ATP binding site of dynein motor region D1-domain-containing protein, partial [Phakopsora pachyrhizi]
MRICLKSLEIDLTRIEKVCSREGEEIPFLTPIILKDSPKINNWLSKVESQMKVSLAKLLCIAVDGLSTFYTENDHLDKNRFLEWVNTFPAQLVVMAVQVVWTKTVEQALQLGISFEGPLQIVLRTLDVLALVFLGELQPVMRPKLSRFERLYHMQFYLDVSVAISTERLSIHIANAVLPYGFEYLGVPDRLVQTPLTDQCYLTLTQALHGQLGGSYFDPAGTGKTESVKALGVQLGRFVLVFCSGETFDFQAMGRIFAGPFQVG